MSVRIFSIAKEIGLENKELLKILQDRGYEVKSVSSTIDKISAEALIEEYKKGGTPAPSPESAEPDPPTSESKAKVTIPPVLPPPATQASPAAKVPPPVSPDSRRPAPALPPSPATPGKAPPAAVPPVRPPSAAPVPPVKQGTTAPPVPPLRAPAPAGGRPSASPRPIPPVTARPGGPPAAGSGGALRSTPRPVPAIPSQPPSLAKSPVSPAALEPKAAEDTEAGESTQREALKKVVVKPPIVVRDFAPLIGIKAFKLISELMDLGTFAALNQTIKEEDASKIALRHGFELDIRHRGDQIAAIKKKQEAEEEDETKFLEPRPPVVCILGHVDHGKTTLLDTIRKSQVVDGEFGGITQHIGAYQIDYKDSPITFLDTPGHAAFSKMRERGAELTDIAVLVVAADDGFKPQTDEALKFAKRSQVEIVVAVTKMDVKGANLERVKTQMQERGIPPEDWGGTTITVPVAALKGEGVDQLLEMIQVQTEVMELKASPRGKAIGVIIESQMEQGKGATAMVIVEKGTLRPGDALVCDTVSCKVRALLNSDGKPVKEVRPGFPARVLGWSDVPDTGARFKAVKNDREAKTLADENLEEQKKRDEALLMSLKSQSALPEDKDAALAALFGAIDNVQKKALRIVLKADVKGSLEAIQTAVQEVRSDKIDLKIVGSGVGPISKKDVAMASAVDAVIVGFNVPIENGVRGLAKHDNVTLYQDNIIYSLLDTIRDAMADLLEPELREKKVGAAAVRAVFPLGKRFVAGCMVTEGRIVRNAQARLMRNGEVVAQARIDSLKRFKDDATEVRAGFECGIRLDKIDRYQEGDEIEVFEIEKIRPSL